MDATNAIGKIFNLQFYHVPTGKIVTFKAFITQLEDSFQTNFNEEPVYGRMDPFRIFQGTQRTMSLAWEIPSHDENEAINNLSNCSLLASMQYPSYSRRNNAATIKGSPVIKIKFANLIASTAPGAFAGGGSVKTNGLAGIMSGMTFSPVVDNGFIPSTVNGSNMLFPKTINLSCNFAVIHQHDLGWRNRSAQSGMQNFPYGVGHSTRRAPSAPSRAADTANPAPPGSSRPQPEIKVGPGATPGASARALLAAEIIANEAGGSDEQIAATSGLPPNAQDLAEARAAEEEARSYNGRALASAGQSTEPSRQPRNKRFPKQEPRTQLNGIQFNDRIPTLVPIGGNTDNG